MKRHNIVIALLFAVLLPLFSQAVTPAFVANFTPFSVMSQGYGHVQGITVDKKNGWVYFSFTTSLVKTDLKGRVLGSVTGFQGHLGCLTFCEADGKVYASLEFKNDAIGKGINKATRRKSPTDNALYIAIFNGAAINRTGISCQTPQVLTAVYLPTVVNDYEQRVGDHTGRYGCSGIDGITFGPKFGSAKGRDLLTVAYGITPDNNRTDNDYQVLLQYSPSHLKRLARPLTQDSLPKSGPAKPQGKYFIYTGNTSWGVQNLAFDRSTGLWLMMVYRGHKPAFPNNTVYVIDSRTTPRLTPLKGSPCAEKALTVPLLRDGLYHAPSGVFSFKFNYGPWGFAPIGNGYAVVSHPFTGKDKSNGSELHIYRWTGNTPTPFTLVK